MFTSNYRGSPWFPADIHWKSQQRISSPLGKPRSFIGEVPHCLGSRRTQRSARWGWVGPPWRLQWEMVRMYGGCTSKVIFWCFFLGGEGLPILGNTMGCNLMILGYMEKNTSKLVVEWGYLRVIELTWISSAGLSSSSRIQMPILILRLYINIIPNHMISYDQFPHRHQWNSQKPGKLTIPQVVLQSSWRLQTNYINTIEYGSFWYLPH